MDNQGHPTCHLVTHATCCPEVSPADKMYSDKVSTTGSETRKNSKPIMEKRRRARINASLTELKSLLLEAIKKEGARHNKMEKADILELAVRHLRQVQRQQISGQTDLSPASRYSLGFSACLQEVARYLGGSSDEDLELKTKLLDHLANCMTGSLDTPPATPPSVSLQPRPDAQSNAITSSTKPVNVNPSPLNINPSPLNVNPSPMTIGSSLLNPKSEQSVTVPTSFSPSQVTSNSTGSSLPGHCDDVIKALLKSSPGVVTPIIQSMTRMSLPTMTNSLGDVDVVKRMDFKNDNNDGGRKKTGKHEGLSAEINNNDVTFSTNVTRDSSPLSGSDVANVHINKTVETTPTKVAVAEQAMKVSESETPITQKAQPQIYLQQNKSGMITQPTTIQLLQQLNQRNNQQDQPKPLNSSNIITNLNSLQFIPTKTSNGDIAFVVPANVLNTNTIPSYVIPILASNSINQVPILTPNIINGSNFQTAINPTADLLQKAVNQTLNLQKLNMSVSSPINQTITTPIVSQGLGPTNVCPTAVDNPNVDTTQVILPKLAGNKIQVQNASIVQPIATLFPNNTNINIESKTSKSSTPLEVNTYNTAMAVDSQQSSFSFVSRNLAAQVSSTVTALPDLTCDEVQTESYEAKIAHQDENLNSLVAEVEFSDTEINNNNADSQKIILDQPQDMQTAPLNLSATTPPKTTMSTIKHQTPKLNNSQVKVPPNSAAAFLDLTAPKQTPVVLIRTPEPTKEQTSSVQSCQVLQQSQPPVCQIEPMDVSTSGSFSNVTNLTSQPPTSPEPADLSVGPVPRSTSEDFVHKSVIQSTRRGNNFFRPW